MAERLAFPIELRVTPGRGASAALHLQLREAILEGRLATGFRLPPTREVALLLGVARATVVVAYDMLVAEGYVRVRRGDGTFVQSIRRTPTSAAARSGRTATALNATAHPKFDLRLGYPDVSRFPFDIWRRMESRAWRAAAKDPYGLSDPAGLIRLREAIAGHASYSRAVSCSAEDLIVTGGAQQAFDLIARTLISPGTIVAVEDPGYPPLRRAFANAGADVVDVPVDEHGIVVSRIPTAAKVICVAPSHQFPIGVTMPAERRAQLLDHAKRCGAYIVEDDYDCEYRYDSSPLDALQTLAPGRVCYVGTFSKTMFPALRLGYAIVPDGLRDRLLEIRSAADGFQAPAPQLALAEFIIDGHLHRHVRRMQRLYGHRRASLLEGLKARLGHRIAILPSKAGLHFSFRLTGAVDWDKVAHLADHHGVGFERHAASNFAGEPHTFCAIGFGLLADDQVELVLDLMPSIFECAEVSDSRAT